MNFHVFAQLFAVIDNATASFVTDVSSRAITTMMPVLTAGLTLSFIFYGLLVARGVVDQSLKDFFFKCLKIGIIVSIASAGGLYQSQIVGAIQNTPNELASALTTNSPQDSSVANALDTAASQGFSKAEDAWQKAGIFSESGIVFALVGVLVLAGTLAFTVVGGAFILLAKVALAILAALGPLFIFSLLFKSTEKFFEKWIEQCLNYGLTIVLVSMVFGFVLKIFTGYIEQVQFNGILNVAGTIGGCLVIVGVCLFILIQLPHLASSVAGGIAVGLWHELRVASGMASKSAGAAKAAGKGTVGAGKLAYSGGKAAAGGVSKAVGRFRGGARAA